jgi:D-alanyl-D-alanine carboxypeptidase/D-alanyl-D-alanine-endopeptidase (penicillin-binding protein 4)
MRRATIHPIRRLLPALLLAATAPAAAADVTAAVRQAAGSNAAVFVVDDDDRVLVDVSGRESFLPASTVKVFTALLALEHLGPEYRFQTRFFRAADELVVHGTGDPFLVSEEIDVIAAALARRVDGRQLGGIVVDDSYFEPGLRIPGVGSSWNPYDAPNTATAVNFNTIGVLRRDGRIISAEPQTPLTPYALGLARSLKFDQGLRFRIGDDPADVRRYVGELFAAKLRAAGVAVADTVRGGGVADEADVLYVHANTRSLAETCAGMLESSNNFVANQIFLALGAAVEGPPASLEKSVRVARRYVEAHPELAGISVVEGSGIAYENRATGPAMTALLRRFAPWRELLHERLGTAHKTGTLKAVATLVGYLDTQHHGTVRYSIALPGGGHARRWQVVEALRRNL